MKTTRALFLVLLISAAGCGSSAFAIVSLEIQTHSEATFTTLKGESAYSSQSDSFYAESFLSSTTDLRLPDEDPVYAAGRGFASSRYGALKALAFEQSDDFSKASALSKASFVDSILIDGGPGLLGSAGMARVLFRLEEALIPNTIATVGVSGGDASFNFRSGSFLFGLSDFIVCTDGRCDQITQVGDSYGTPYALGSGPNLFEVEFPVTFGQYVDIHLFLSAGAYGGQGVTALTADSSHSFYWGGIQLIRDSFGNSTDDFFVTSISGTDYKQSYIPSTVPEPGSLALITLGAAALLHSRRHGQVGGKNRIVARM